MPILKKITQEQLDALRERGFTHYARLSKRALDGIEYAQLPAWALSDQIGLNYSPLDLGESKNKGLKALCEFDSLPDYNPNGFIPSDVLIPGCLYRESDDSPIIRTTATPVGRDIVPECEDLDDVADDIDTPSATPPSINLTQHKASADQISAGVTDFQIPSICEKLTKLLTFDTLPTSADIDSRVEQIARLAAGFESAMIGGAPFLMPALAGALKKAGIIPLYAFSRRKAIDGPDGQKISIFQHEGFVHS